MSTVRDPIYGCELVTGHLTPDGYGRVGKTLGHIAAWRAARGPVPPDRTLDHACRRRNCRAVHHLEPVTARENLLRREWSYRVRIKLCPAGHDLQENRAVTPEGGITCRLCNRAAVARWRNPCAGDV